MLGNSIRVIGQAILPILLVLSFTGCFGGGGGSSTTSSAPVISNLQYSPQSTFLNNGDGSIIVNATFNFTDNDGDLSSYSLDIFDSNNSLIDSLSGDVSGTSGIISGTLHASLIINTTIVDDYQFELYLTDSIGNQSNILSGLFSVLGPVKTASTIPNTGVNKCYNQSSIIDCPLEGKAFYGQDFHYSSNEMSFTDNADGTVTDNVTLLMWHQIASIPTYNWYEASGTYDATYNASSINVCDALAVGAHTDWRLPTRRELESIVNYGTGEPSAIDAIYFPNGNFEYWSVTDDGLNARFVDFTDGSVRQGEKLSSKYVRCVRGVLWGGNVFVDNGDGTVSDSQTGLMWQWAYDQGRDWEEQLSYCEGLTLAGHADWRLPDIKELETLIGAESDVSTGSGIYCSSSTIADYQDSVWLIQFSQTSNYGDVFRHAAGSSKHFCASFYFRCVR